MEILRVKEVLEKYMKIARFGPAFVKKVTRSPHHSNYFSTFQASRWLCETKFFIIRRLKTFILVISRGYLWKSNIPIENKPGFLPIYCKPPSPPCIMHFCSKKEEDTLELRFPPSCFGSGQWLSNMEIWVFLYVLYMLFSTKSQLSARE